MLKKINIVCIMHKWNYICIKSLNYGKNKYNALTYIVSSHTYIDGKNKN